MTSDALVNSSWADHSGADPTSRIEADRVQHYDERLRAARVIAASARDTDEARDLLAMLGLGADEVRAAQRRRTAA